MRQDQWNSFAQYNWSESREPKFVAIVDFPDYSIALTTHEGILGVPVAQRYVEGVIQSVSSTSQRVMPLEGRSEIGSLTIKTLDTVDELRPVYDFRPVESPLLTSSDYFQTSGGNYSGSRRTRITGKGYVRDAAQAMAFFGVNPILRLYTNSSGDVRVYEAGTATNHTTGITLSSYTLNRWALEWDGAGNWLVDINGTTATGTYDPDLASNGKLFIGGNSSRQIDGYMWDVRTYEAADVGLPLHPRAFYPLNDNTGTTFQDRIGSDDAALVNSPQVGVWVDAQVGEQFSNWLRGALVPKGSPLDSGHDIREKKIRVYMGFTDYFEDYEQIASTYVSGLAYKAGVYTLSCRDVTRQIRKTVFDKKKTNLASNLTDGTESPYSAVHVRDTSAFEAVYHTQAFTEAPGETVGYLKIVDTGEIIRWTSKSESPAEFVVTGRGLFGTTAQAVTVSGTDPDEWPEVEEFIYLEMPAPQLAYAVLTGYYLGDTSSPRKQLPEHWNAGVPLSYMSTTEWEEVGEDLYDGDITGLITRFIHLKKTDAKKFVEQEIHRLCGTFSPVNSDGTIGLRKINEIIAGGAADAYLTNVTVSEHNGLKHSQSEVVNQILVRWNWDGENFTRSVLYQDADSIARNGASEFKELQFKGLYPARHTVSQIRTLVTRYMDRFRNPPQRITLDLMPYLNFLEANDVVNVKLLEIEDYDGFSAGNTTYLNRPFEIERANIDWMNGKVKIDCFGSSGTRADDIPIGTSAILPDAFYTSKGTEFTAAGLSVDGSGNLTADGTLTGYESGLSLSHDANHADSIFYYDGDFTIPAGRTLTIHHSVQLRIKGTLTINGKIDGAGNGWVGETDPNVVGTAYSGGIPTFDSATRGYVGGIRSMDGMVHNYLATFDFGGVEYFPREYSNLEGYTRDGLHSSFPEIVLETPDTTTSPVFDDLLGIPATLTGARGVYGAPLLENKTRLFNVVFREDVRNDYLPRCKVDGLGGDAGDSGAGLAIISRGVSFGLSAEIDLSGTDGSLGDKINCSQSASDSPNIWFTGYPQYVPISVRAGSGSGGGQGSLFIAIDGGDQLFPDPEPYFTANAGDVPYDGRGLIIDNRSLLRATGNVFVHESPRPNAHGYNADMHNQQPLGALIPNGTDLDRASISYRVQYVPEPPL
jgi:hypothetical protein